MYIGNTVQNQGFTPQVDFFSGNASTTAFTLSRPVASTYQMIVVVANVTQNPGSSYTVSGNTITFSSAPPTGTNNIWVEYTSLITQVIQPSAGTVGTLQLLNGTVVTSIDATIHGLTVGLGGGSYSSNTALGVNALSATNTGGYTTAVGNAALQNNTSGAWNTAFGFGPLNVNSTGSYNTSVGGYALVNNTTASNNTAVGYQAGYSQSTSTDNRNTFIGSQAGYSANNASVSQSGNTAIGYQAGYSLTTGAGNCFVGPGNGSISNPAGYNMTTGSNNTIFGGYTGNQNSMNITTLSNKVVLSDGAGNVGFHTDSSQWANNTQGTIDITNNSAASANVNVLSVASGSSSAIFGNGNNFSGLIIINDINVTGGCAVFVTGGGAIALLGGTTGFVQSSSPASGLSGLYIAGGNVVTVKNNTAGTVYYRIMGFRTRSSQ